MATPTPSLDKLAYLTALIGTPIQSVALDIWVNGNLLQPWLLQELVPVFTRGLPLWLPPIRDNLEGSALVELNAALAASEAETARIRRAIAELGNP